MQLARYNPPIDFCFYRHAFTSKSLAHMGKNLDEMPQIQAMLQQKFANPQPID